MSKRKRNRKKHKFHDWVNSQNQHQKKREPDVPIPMKKDADLEDNFCGCVLSAEEPARACDCN